MLTLAKSFDDAVQYRLSVSDLRDLSGNASTSGMSQKVASLLPVIQMPEVHSFDGTSDGIDKGEELLAEPGSAGARMPVGADAPWTINVFVWVDRTPADLTTFAGFGNDADISRTQRYIVKMHNKIAFWGSNVDEGTNAACDVGKWQMLTATYSGTTLRIYKNASLLKTAEIDLTDAAPIARLAPPGPWQEAHRFKGKLAGFAIWDRELDEDGIARLMRTMPAQ